MNRAEAETKIKAAAYVAADAVGIAEAVRMLQQAARELEDTQWKGPGNR